MLYSAEKGNKTSFRGKVWQLPNRYWRACNYSGQQCSYKTYNEAHIFAAKGKPAEVKPLNESTVLNEGAKAMAVARVLAKAGFKLKWKKDGVISWASTKHFSTAGETEVQVSNTSGEWTVYVDTWGNVADGQGPADLDRWFKSHTFSRESVMEGLKRQQTRYRPDLSKSQMEQVVANLEKQGYKASSFGPNLTTDATDQAIDDSY